MPEITVLTHPVGGGSQSLYDGHHGVTRSLVEGLSKIGADFNYNHRKQKDVGAVVVVLSGIDALQQAIGFKQTGKIQKLLAGPNLMVRAMEYNNILSSPEIDICIVPSDWVRIAYEADAPDLAGRIRCWYAGIDERFWRPDSSREKDRQVLIYWKTETKDFYKGVKKLLKGYGWLPVKLEYGRHSRDEFRETLSGSVFAVFISRSESQGIALAEAWAMDVPTLVWNPKELAAHGRVYSTVSACPYLTDLTGLDWVSLEEFDKVLGEIEIKLNAFKPREWVLANMTDEVSSQLLLRVIGSLSM